MEVQKINIQLTPEEVEIIQMALDAFVSNACMDTRESKRISALSQKFDLLGGTE